MVEADLVALGIFDGDSVPAEIAAAPGAGAAKGSFKSLAAIFPQDGPRLLVVGRVGGLAITDLVPAVQEDHQRPRSYRTTW